MIYIIYKLGHIYSNLNLDSDSYSNSYIGAGHIYTLIYKGGGIV